MKKRSLWIIALVWLVLLSACSDSNQDSGPLPATPKTPVHKYKQPVPVKEQAQKPAAPYWSEQPAKLKIFMASHANWSYKRDWPVWDWIEEDTNIQVEAMLPSGDYADTLALTMASGELPDLVQLWARDDARYGQAGALLDLTKHLDEIPNLQRYWEEHPEAKQMVTMPDGAVYMAVAEGASFSNQRAWQYREDLFDRHQLEPPSTWEELYEAATLLKKLYPDSYPLVFRGGMNSLGNVSMAFGVFDGFYPDPVSGETRFGPVEEPFKEMVVWLRRFYQEGLLPPDWLTLTTNQWTEYILNNQAFITVDYIGRIEFFNLLFPKGSTARMAFMAPPAGIGDKGYVPDAYFNREGLAISARSDNTEAAYRYINYLYSEEGKERLSWGKEGETYERIEGEKRIVGFQDLTELRKATGIATYGAYGVFEPEAAFSMMSEDEALDYQRVAETAFPIKVISPTMSKEDYQIYSVSGLAIEKHYEESVSRFIVGEKPMSEWEKYVREYEKLGFEEVRAIYDEGWHR